MVGRKELIERQHVLPRFGEYVLGCDDLHKVLDEGCRLIAKALDADLSKVLEIERTRNAAFVFAGYGWNEGVVRNARLALGDRSSEAYALDLAEPVIIQDIAAQTRFDIPDFAKAHGVRALVNVPIFLPGGEAFGLLQIDFRRPRAFSEEGVKFLRTFAAILGSVIDRLRKLHDLKDYDERLGLILESAHDYAILLTDPQDIVTDWLAGSETIFGWKAHEIVGQPASVLFTDEDRAAGVPKQETALACHSGVAPNVRWHQRKDASRVFIDGQTVALRAGDGTVRGYMKIGQDTTERRRDQDRQAVLLAELQHRVRNVLAMVRSVVAKGGGASTEDYRTHMIGRINAMARTQALLTRGVGVGVDLEEMVRDEITSQATDEQRVVISGPKVALAPKAAEVLTLAIHELATNGLKYGALGQEAGRVDVSWSIDPTGDGPWLRLTWRESGVRLAAIAPQRTGFGTELIVNRVPYELRGRGAMDLQPGGLCCTIEFPLVAGQSVLQSDGPLPLYDAPQQEKTA